LASLAILLSAAPGAGVPAQNLESAIMPGRVSRGHAGLEADCGNCHVRFNRAAQPRLCLGCHDHRDIAADVRAKAGYHGRIAERECRSCHTEHKGREARIVALDEKKFDHDLSDFGLRGRHADLACARCHRAGTRHREAPGACVGCHRNDDRHKGALGAKCESCHDASGWKNPQFDHARTRFPLRLRHAKAGCADCHAGERYAGTARECVSCHRRDDAHKGHFGTRCESCHDEASWKTPLFAHDRDTRFALRGRHRIVKCESCHRAPLYRERTPSACHACHRDDDVHKGTLGAKCESCHVETGWKGSRFNHDRDTRFPLRERHRYAKCESCHRDAGFREKPSATCAGCHERDDRERGHEGRFGAKCETCHSERAWKAVNFDHDRDTPYRLRGGHRQAKCDACHRGALYEQKPSTRCMGCHERDDRHKGQLGGECGRCHTERSWREAPFDHDQSRFPLRGRHARIECRACHLSPAFKDAPTACAGCHARDDAHRQRLGPRCDDCHGVDTWKKWNFDHDQRTRFPLTGVHAGTKCVACHSRPVEGRLTLATGCLSCHRKDDIHFGTYGAQCDRCHVTSDWRRIVKRPPAAGGAATVAPGSRSR
jgi:predicted CXXCH cytochrome family protein